MTTKMLQVGDIVRINEPTKQDIEDMEFEGCGYTFKDVVGRLAVVTRVECAEHTIVQLVTCTEDYEFQLSDTRQLYWSSGIWTVTSHLSLVRESVLRTYILSEEIPKPLTSKPLPHQNYRSEHCCRYCICGTEPYPYHVPHRKRGYRMVRGACGCVHKTLFHYILKGEPHDTAISGWRHCSRT